MENKEKVVIVGGGIAGLMAAKTLAESGLSPLLLERGREFGQKACGELITENSYGFFIYDFLSKELWESIILKRFDGFIINFWDKEYYLTNKNSPSRTFPDTPLSINRKKLEETLAKEAVSLGARVRLDKEVKKIERKGKSILINGEIETDVLIGADGFHSLVRKFTGQKVGNCSFAVSAKAESNYEFPVLIFNPKIVPKGYAWIFPGESNVGCGQLGEKTEIMPCFEKFIGKFNLKAENIRGAFIPAQRPLKTYFDNILLAGDAACFADSFLLGGINAAMVTGFLAAKTAKQAIDGNNTGAAFLKRYEREWKKRMRNNLMKSYFYQKVFYGFLLNNEKIGSLILKVILDKK